MRKYLKKMEYLLKIFNFFVFIISSIFQDPVFPILRSLWMLLFLTYHGAPVIILRSLDCLLCNFYTHHQKDGCVTCRRNHLRPHKVYIFWVLVEFWVDQAMSVRLSVCWKQNRARTGQRRETKFCTNIYLI